MIFRFYLLYYVIYGEATIWSNNKVLYEFILFIQMLNKYLCKVVKKKNFGQVRVVFNLRKSGEQSVLTLGSLCLLYVNKAWWTQKAQSLENVMIFNSIVKNSGVLIKIYFRMLAISLAG